MKIENFQNSHEERHIPISSLVKNSHKKLEDPQNDKEFKTPKFENTKTKYLQSFQKKIKYPISSLVKLHTKKLKTPKMTRNKLKKIGKQKTFKVHMKKSTYPISSLVKFHRNFFEDPQNDKKKIENSKTSKYKNNFFQNSQEKRKIPLLPPCETSHKFFFKPTK